MVLHRMIPGVVALLLVAVAATAGAQFSLDFGEPATFSGFDDDDDDDDDAFGGGSLFDDDDPFGFDRDRVSRLGGGGGGTRISYSVDSDDYATPQGFQRALEARAEAARQLTDLETQCEVQAEVLRARIGVTDGDAREELRSLQDRCADARADLRVALGEPARRTRVTTTTGGGSFFGDGFGSGFGSFEPIRFS